jgi:hypothetical protein
MLGFFRSESAKQADEDADKWRREGFDDFKREVHRATDGMLDYELIYYRGLFHSISLAEGDSEQMRLSGGRPWVEWLKKKYLIEIGYIRAEVERRSGTGHKYTLYGSIVSNLHSWEVKRLVENGGAIGLREIASEWNF